MKVKKASEAFFTCKQMLGLSEDKPIPDFMMEVLPTGMPSQFSVRKLQQMEVNEESIFGDEDFIYQTDKDDDRASYVVKMGVLLFQVIPFGKGGYELDVEIINKENRTKNLLFHFTGQRYPEFQFDEIVPFECGGATSTFMGRKRSLEIPFANRIRDLLTKMALGCNDDEIRLDLQTAIVNFFAEVNRPRNTSQSFKERIKNLDVCDFGKDFTKKPKSNNELSAKLAASFLCNLGVNRQEFKEIIDSYIIENDISLEEIDEKWVLEITNTLVDKNRYCLKTILPEENNGDILRGIIKEIKEETKSFNQKPSHK